MHIADSHCCKSNYIPTEKQNKTEQNNQSQEDMKQQVMFRKQCIVGYCFLASEVISKTQIQTPLKLGGRGGVLMRVPLGSGHWIWQEGSSGRKGEGGQEQGWGTRLHFSQKLNMAGIEFGG